MEALARPGAGGTPEPSRPPTARPGPARALVFVGFMGAGKSTTARAVAAQLGVDALDTDRELERELGESFESFFDRHGEPAFREREEALVARVLARDDVHVVALGGGAVESDAVRAALARHAVVYLDVDAEEAWRRASGKGRPLARDKLRFEQLLQDREQLYESVAHAFLPPRGRDLAHRVLPALVRLRDARLGTAMRLVWATQGSGDYPVYIARGLLASGFFEPTDGRRFLVTDARVAAAQAGAASGLEQLGRLELVPGEPSKTLAEVERTLRAMAQAGVERGDLVAALGGGVVGDLAGLCAALYQRGIRHVQVPTTLVAQVDSAYGGKTGVDLPEGKNYAGAYHHPASVLVDPELLATLPAAELAAGYAEVVKTALIAGGELWSRVRQGAEPDDEVILRSLRTKLSVVAQDERDEGRRQVLNLGHTVAHAIEAATGYRRLRHGEAVALGLLCALRLSGRESIRSEVAELLAARGLALRLDGLDPDQVIALVSGDKKRRDGRVPFVLVESPGSVSPGHEVTEGELRRAVEEVVAA